MTVNPYLQEHIASVHNLKLEGKRKNIYNEANLKLLGGYFNYPILYVHSEFEDLREIVSNAKLSSY